MNNPAVSDRFSVEDQVIAEIRRHLKRQRWSARQAAMEIGWSEMYISRRLGKKTPFDLRDLEALAELLEVRVIDFFVPLEESPRQLTHARSRSLAVGRTNPCSSSPCVIHYVRGPLRLTRIRISRCTIYANLHRFSLCEIAVPGLLLPVVA